jgi:hypothetical protein
MENYMNTSIHNAKRASVGIAAAFKAQAEDAAAQHMLSWLSTELADLRAARVTPPKVVAPELINYGHPAGAYANVAYGRGRMTLVEYGHPVKVTRVRRGHRTLHMSFTYGGAGQHSLAATQH